MFNDKGTKNKKPAESRCRRAANLMSALYFNSYRPPPTRTPRDDGDGDERQEA